MRLSESLERDGYAVLPNFLSAERVRELTDAVERLYDAEGSRAGSEFRQEPNTRRLANMVDKGPLFREMIAEPDVLRLVAEVLGAEFKLGSLNARSADPMSDIAQPLLPESGKAAHPNEVLVTGSAGTVIVMNAHMWHGGTANRTHAPRRALHGFYCRSDRPQQQYQKDLLHPDTIADLTVEERKILGLDDPENDRLSGDPSRVVSGFLKA